MLVTAEAVEIRVQVLYDNIRTVVTERDHRGRGLHRHKTFLDFADHHGFLPRLCRPHQAKTRGKVERFIGYPRRSFYLPLASQLSPEGLPVDCDTGNARVGTCCAKWPKDLLRGLLKKALELIHH